MVSSKVSESQVLQIVMTDLVLLLLRLLLRVVTLLKEVTNMIDNVSYFLLMHNRGLVLTLCKFHYCESHYCDFSKKSINLP